MHLFPVPISVANYLHWEFKKNLNFRMNCGQSITFLQLNMHDINAGNLHLVCQVIFFTILSGD